MKNSKKGFTLVELIVSITLIGIILTVAYIAINPSDQTGKARDSKTKAQIGAARSQMASILFSRSDDGGYSGAESDNKITSLLNGLKNASVTSSESGWAVKAQLANDNYYCRDSTGKVSEKSVQDITDYQCD